MNPKKKTALIVCGLGALSVGGILLMSRSASAAPKDRDRDKSEDDLEVTTPDGTTVVIEPSEPEPSSASEPEPSSASEPEPSSASEPEPETEPEPEPEPELDTEPETEPERDLSNIKLKTRYYIVKAGDSPYKVAEAFTGNGARWTELQKENQKYDFTKQFWAGMELKLPSSWPDSPVLTSTAPETPPLVETETSPEHDPNGTIALAHELLMLESTPDWKYKHQDAVAEWQKRVGTLVPDGKFGPKSALRMAEEVAILPYVRFWSHWDKNQGLKEYRDSLLELADKLESESPAKKAHAEGLRMSAAREKAQSFPSKPAPQTESEKEVREILDSLGADAADQAINSILNRIS